MTTTVHPIIYNFLKDWLEWVDKGAIEPNLLFARRNPLCTALDIFLSRHTLLHSMQIHRVRLMFEKLLRDTVGRADLPFNASFTGMLAELYACDAGAHTNTKRIEWVRSIVNYEQPTVA